MMFSVVIPIFSCSVNIEELISRLECSLQNLSEEYEILLINDASLESDWKIIKKFAIDNKKLKGINLSRNFGQHYAITAGLVNAQGEWIIVMDCDLQDQPEEIVKLYNKAKEGFDIVYAKRTIRKDSFIKRKSSVLFYAILSYLTDTKQDSSIANFGIYNKKVIEAILKMKDSIKYFPTMSQWVGFKKTSINVEHAKRNEGKSSYSIKKLLKLAFDNIITFSNKPLKLMVKLGFFIVFIVLLFGSYFAYLYIKGEIVVLGYASLILSIWFLSGIIMMMLGVLGIYLGKVFDQVKDRPTYIISEKINL